MNTPVYTTMGSGENVRLCVTSENTTTVIATVPAERAEVLVSALTTGTTYNWGRWGAAAAADGRRCELRRVLGDVLAGDPGEPAPGYWESYQRSMLGRGADPHGVGLPLAYAMRGLTGPVRRSIIEHVLEMVADTDDVLVPVEFRNEIGHSQWATFANEWLTQATDDEIVSAHHGCSQASTEAAEAWHENLDNDVVHFYADADEDLYDMLSEGFLWADMKPHHIAGWVGLHRPHLLERLAA